MDNKTLAISKLIILTIVKQIPSITSNQLTNLALETLYMDYFTYIQAYQELVRDHMLISGIRKEENDVDASGKPIERCDITSHGLTVLNTLDGQIPLHVKTYLLQATGSRKRDIKRDHEVRAAYEPDANGHYNVELSQHDGVHDLINIKLSVPDKQLARRICTQWKKQPGLTYVSLLALLTGESEKPFETGAVTNISAIKNSTSVDISEINDDSEPAKPYKTEQRLF